MNQVSLIGNLLREMSKAATSVGEAIVNGTADVAEVITGPNQVTTAARETGVKVLHGAKSITDALVDMGEKIITGRSFRRMESEPSPSQQTDQAAQG